MTTPYSDGFFTAIADGCERSAAVIVPLLVDLLGPKSVVDVGCGWGAWLRAFRATGVTDLFGVDGPHVDTSRTGLAPTQFVSHDLARPFTFPRRFDLAICLEVAEHLPATAADTLVDALATAAPVVAFSAAIPGQGGTHHVNEQWPEYWAKLFAARGLVPVDAIRPLVWARQEVEWWYTQNLILFARPEVVVSNPRLARTFADTRPDQLAVVHPRCFSRYARRRDAG